MLTIFSIFLLLASISSEWVTPDNVIGEPQDDWRPVFTPIFSKMVEGCTNNVQRVQTINAHIWDVLNVHYSTERDEPRQSPFHSMRTHKASCTGMAILQVCAYRSVGIPARLVGCNWTTIPGNHSWVEFMDEAGEWHFFGDGNPSPIDDSWVAPFAAEADESDPSKHIFASRATPKDKNYYLWDFPADDITARYRKYKPLKHIVPTNTNYTLPTK